jgi:hypothetical protein
MGHADHPQEWLRLNERYQQMGEDELLQLRNKLLMTSLR